MLEKGDKPGETEKGITYAEIMSYQKGGGDWLSNSVAISMFACMTLNEV